MSKWFGMVQVGACQGMQQPIRLGVGGLDDLIPTQEDLPARALFTGAGGLAGWLIAKSPLGAAVGAALGFIAPPLVGEGWGKTGRWQGSV